MTDVLTVAQIIRVRATALYEGNGEAWDVDEICDSHEALRAERDEARRERDAERIGSANCCDSLERADRDAERLEAELDRVTAERNEWRGRAEGAESMLRINIVQASELYTRCRTIHGDYPPGTTCRDVQQIAKDHPERYGQPYLGQLIAGEHLCLRCRIAEALDAAGSVLARREPDA